MLDNLNERLRELIERASEGLEVGWDSMCEMADSLSKIKETIRDLAPNLFRHLYLIYVYGEQPKYKSTVHHWVSEIAANLYKYCNKVDKNSKKPISTKIIVNALISKFVNYKEMQEIINKTADKYGEIEEKNNNNAYYEQIYQRIINVLPETVQYVKDAVRVEIDELEKIILNN